MTEADPTREMYTNVLELRRKFSEMPVPHRPDLFRYCQALAQNVWDTEDLVQETFARAFAKLGEIYAGVRDVRAYLFRMATNLWIDRTRRQEPLTLDQESTADDHGHSPHGDEVRQALLSLAGHLPPRERATLLLKDIFDFSLDQTAAFLATSTGAVKAALHRGRERLRCARGAPPPPPAREGPPERLVDDFVSAFNARDIDRLVGMMLEGASAEVIAAVEEYGRETTRGSLSHTIGDKDFTRAERVVVHGEPMAALWHTTGVAGERREAIHEVVRIEAADGKISRFRYYYFCPEAMVEVGKMLGLPVQTTRHHY